MSALRRVIRNFITSKLLATFDIIIVILQVIISKLLINFGLYRVIVSRVGIQLGIGLSQSGSVKHGTKLKGPSVSRTKRKYKSFPWRKQVLPERYRCSCIDVQPLPLFFTFFRGKWLCSKHPLNSRQGAGISPRPSAMLFQPTARIEGRLKKKKGEPMVFRFNLPHARSLVHELTNHGGEFLPLPLCVSSMVLASATLRVLYFHFIGLTLNTLAVRWYLVKVSSSFGNTFILRNCTRLPTLGNLQLDVP